MHDLASQRLTVVWKTCMLQQLVRKCELGSRGAHRTQQAPPSMPTAETKALPAGENRPGNFPRDPEEKAKLVGKDNPEIHPNVQSAPEGQVKSASGANTTYDKVGSQQQWLPLPSCAGTCLYLGLSITA